MKEEILKHGNIFTNLMYGILVKCDEQLDCLNKI